MYAEEEQKFGIKDVENESIVAFQSSITKKPEELTNYLQDLMTDSYNKYCIDCKVNLSTHAMVFFGIFVCEECA